MGDVDESVWKDMLKECDTNKYGQVIYFIFLFIKIINFKY